LSFASSAEFTTTYSDVDVVISNMVMMAELADSQLLLLL
jgi:hypothetical protein